MEQMEQMIVQYWQHHGVVGLAAVWFVLSAVINTLTRIKSPTELVEMLDKVPGGHAAIAFCRGLGVDPIALLEAAKVYAEKKAATEAAEEAAKNEIPKL